MIKGKIILPSKAVFKTDRRQQISATIITKNEETNIARCLKSLDWVDEIVVVDSFSTDKTEKICRQFKCQFFQSEWLGYGCTKNVAVKHASHNWILSIDADEEVSPALKDRIEKELANPQAVGYRLKRRSFYLGKKIAFCGWQRDYPLRLFDRRYGAFNDKPIHEGVELAGTISRIEEPLFHYTYPTVQSHILKMDKYAELAAEQAFANGKTASFVGALVRGGVRFFKMYYWQAGFLDGKYGLLLAYNSAFGVYLKYLKLWEKSR